MFLLSHFLAITCAVGMFWVFLEVLWRRLLMEQVINFEICRERAELFSCAASFASECFSE